MKKLLKALLFIIVSLVVITKIQNQANTRPIATKYDVEFSMIDLMNKKSTDAQYDFYSKGYQDKIVTWDAKIIDVSPCLIDVCSNVNVSFSDMNKHNATFKVHQTVGLQLDKGSTYNFTGTIKYVTKIFGTAFVYFYDDSITLGK